MGSSRGVGAGIVLACVATQLVAGGRPECFTAEVEDHVLAQFRTYGPRSGQREWFGFVYRHDGVIGSAVVGGNLCRWARDCEVNSSRAATLIPRGSQVLGEWHTHPHVHGSNQLSGADARGAFANRSLRCYRAFFSTSAGDILTWDVSTDRPSIAMATAVHLGNYHESTLSRTQVAGIPP